MYACCISRPGFLPDPNDGSLYVLGGKHKEGLMVRNAVCVCLCQFVCLFSLFDPIVLVHLQKLPFTIPELVQSAPCRSSDGILYTGETCRETYDLFITVCETDRCQRWRQTMTYSINILLIVFVCVCLHIQVKSRMFGLWWILRQVRNKPV